jgi:tRNA-dihydrouridine synthase
VNIFKEALKISKNKVCYNGDIFCVDDYKRIVNECPGIEGVMIGRGALQNPAIFREIRGGKSISRDELLEFSGKLMKIYDEGLRSEVYTLHKMKEIWHYMILNFPEDKKINKAIINCENFLFAPGKTNN